MHKHIGGLTSFLSGLFVFMGFNSIAEDYEVWHNTQPWIVFAGQSPHARDSTLTSEERRHKAQDRLKSYAFDEGKSLLEKSPTYQKLEEKGRNILDRNLTLRIGDVPSKHPSKSEKDLTPKKQGRFIKINPFEVQGANPNHIQVEGRLHGTSYEVNIRSPWKPMGVPLPNIDCKYGLRDSEANIWIGYDFKF